MDLSDLTKHFSTPGGEAFDVTPEAALDFFQAKGLKPTFNWQEMIGREHAVAFTVAKMTDIDLLKDMRESLDNAIATGKPFQVWADEIIPTLQAKGWWGKKSVIDANTGKVVTAQLGSPARLRTIFRTNLQSAYAVGQWDQIEQQAAEAPYLLYDAIDDHRTRPEHAAWDGKVLPVDSSFWKTHTPPNGWNCRCSVIQLDEDDLEQLGLTPEPRAPRFETYKWTNPFTGEVFDIPFGVDPGFGTAAANRITKMQALLRQKASNLPSDMIPSAEKGLAALKAETEAATQQALKDLAKGLGQSRLASSQEKLAQLAAEIEIQNAQASKVPYLAAALKKVLQTAGRKKPSDVIAEAKALAEKNKQSAMLSGYKKSYLTEKEPTAPQKAAFEALPDEAKLSMLADLDAQIAAAKAKQAATAALKEAYEATPGSTIGKAVAQLQKAGKWDTSDPVALKALLDETADQVKQQKAITDGVSAYKKNAIAGKVPTPAQKAAFDSLPDDKKEKLLGEIDAAKAKAAPATPPQAAAAAPEAEIDTDNLVQIGPQKGSNPGGLYQDVTTGRKWYIKTPSSPDIARNEVLAAKLYDAAGIDVPTLRLVEFNGSTSIASEIVEGLTKGSPADLAKAAGTADGFGVDAWLANWDVVGLGYDNLLLKGAKAFRVDTGGALRYRAQGGLKGSAFGRSVDEIDSLRDPRTNTQSASVYGNLTPAELDAGVRKVLAIDDDQIRALVRQHGPLDAGEADALADLLIARKADLYERFPNARPLRQAPAVLPDPDARVSPVEFKAIADSRVNGYAIKTDKNQIEDHNVLISHFRQPGNGGDITRGQLKLTPSAGRELEKAIEQGLGKQTIAADASPVNTKILELIKGVNSRAAKGELLEQKNLDRLRVALDGIDEALASLEKVRRAATPGVDQAAVLKQMQFLEQWKYTIRSSMDGLKATDKAVAIPGQFDLQFLKPILQVTEGQGGGIKWLENRGWSMRIASFDRSRATLTGNTESVPGVSKVYTAEIDGVRVEYVPFDGNPSGRAFQGTIHIDIKGATPESAAKVFDTLERMGISSARATDIDRKELYTNKIARLYTVKDSAGAKQWETLNRIDDQDRRIREKLQWLNGVTGKDIEASDYFASYHGQHQASGHGRSLQFRADLDEAEFRKFSKEYVIYHNPTGLGWGAGDSMIDKMKIMFEGGGMMISAAERARRGVTMQGGTSIAPDIRTGGGNYVFTRLGKLSGASRHKHAGIYWSPSNLRRTDAITYGNDRFGETTDDSLRTRSINPTEWRKAATGSTNETIFKDGLSIFDDVERIILPRQSQYREMIDWLRSRGYDKWPDGRELEDVLGYVGQ